VTIEDVEYCSWSSEISPREKQQCSELRQREREREREKAGRKVTAMMEERQRVSGEVGRTDVDGRKLRKE